MVESKAKEAREAALKLAGVSSDVRNKALKAIATAIAKNKEAILDANARDVEEAEKLVEKGELSEPMLQRLKLSAEDADSP